MKLDSTVRYTETHEWARPEGDEFVVGISDYAQSELPDVMRVELPDVGDTFTKGEAFGVVETVKAAAEIFVPLSGEVTALNEALEATPELVNQDPYGAGWLIRLKASDPAEWDQLLDGEAYTKVVEAEKAKH
jgi:glycine cleavage system H protein